MRVIAFPHLGIAYNNAFYASLEKQGCEVIAGNFSGRWLLNNLGKTDVVHIHWPSFLYLSTGPYVKIIRSFFRFILMLSIISLKRVKIVWTAHNLLPHKRCKLPVLDVISRHVIIALSSHIYVHGEEVKQILVARFPRCKNKCVIIPHGNWIDAYPTQPPREEALAALQLPKDSFVYLAFGQCAPYKNLEGLVSVFLREETASNYLLIAGNFKDPSYLAKITELAKGNPRVRIDARFIPDNEVPRYLSVCNVLCMPYNEILTSGTTMLALSFGKPVISIDKGFLRDVITQDTGILIPPGDDEELATAMRKARELPWSSDQIIRHSQKFTFDDAAAIFLNTTQ